MTVPSKEHAFHQFIEEFQSSGAAWLHDKLLSLQVSFHTFDRNFRELEQAMQRHCAAADKRSFGDFYHRRARNESLMELSRLLHNFLAASKSLLDHTRVFMNEVYEHNPGVRSHLQEETRRYFEQHPVAGFTKDFRNFAQHVGIPFITSVMPSAGRVYLALNTERVETKRAWSVAAKNYLATQKQESIELSPYVGEYHAVVNRHYEWLLQCCQGHFGEPWTMAVEFFSRWEKFGETSPA